MGSQPTPNPLIESLLCWIDKAGEAILALKPVTFGYEELDPAGVPQFGLVAEQVEKLMTAVCIDTKENAVICKMFGDAVRPALCM